MDMLKLSVRRAMDAPLKFLYQFKIRIMGKITVLIVDDHTLIRETWSFLLGRNENFEVIAEVGDGQRAIDIARDKRPNIVLLDINMTPLNGFDVLKMVRKQSPGSKVIAVSMHSQPAYAKKCCAWALKVM